VDFSFSLCSTAKARKSSRPQLKKIRKTKEKKKRVHIGPLSLINNREIVAIKKKLGNYENKSLHTKISVLKL
jgi:hypothetical protein